MCYSKDRANIIHKSIDMYECISIVILVLLVVSVLLFIMILIEMSQQIKHIMFKIGICVNTDECTNSFEKECANDKNILIKDNLVQFKKSNNDYEHYCNSRR